MLEGMNGRSLLIEVNSSDNIEEFIFSTNWSKSFKGGYYELMLHNTIENGNKITNYKNSDILNETGKTIYSVLFIIFLIIIGALIVYLIETPVVFFYLK